MKEFTLEAMSLTLMLAMRSAAIQRGQSDPLDELTDWSFGYVTEAGPVSCYTQRVWPPVVVLTAGLCWKFEGGCRRSINVSLNGMDPALNIGGYGPPRD